MTAPKWLDGITRDLRFAIRTLRGTPGFTAIAIVTLALGLGANTAMFAVVNGVLLQPLPYRNPAGLVQIFGETAGAPGAGPARRIPAVPLADLATLKSQARTLSHLTFSTETNFTLVAGDEAIRVEGARLSSDAFSMLGVQPVAGRVFDSRDAGATDTVVVLSQSFWKRHFNGRVEAIGEFLTLDDKTYQVIGVMPESFRFPSSSTQVWVPLVPSEFPRLVGTPIGRLQQGVPLDAASLEINTILRQLHPERGVSARYELVRIRDEMVANVKPALVLLSVAVALVLLVACANLTCLLLSRSAARERAIAVRLALGVERWRLMRELLVENLVLALGGAALGMGLAIGGVRLLHAAFGGLPRRDVGRGVVLPRMEEVTINGRVLAFLLAAAILTAVASGLWPAIRASLRSPIEALRGGTEAGTSGLGLFRRRRAHSVLIAVEIAVATMLAISCGLLVHSLINLSQVNVGFTPADVTTAQVTFPRGRYQDAQFRQLAQDIVADLMRIPEIEGAGYARQLPTLRIRQLSLLRMTPALPPHLPTPPPFDGRQLPEMPDTRIVSTDFLRVLRVRLVAGRMFDERDNTGKPQVMLINESLAKSGFLGDHPLGRQVYALGQAPWEIIGIVADVHQFDLDKDPDPQIFIDFRQEPSAVDGRAAAVVPPPAPYFAVRSQADPSIVAAHLRRVIHQREPRATVDNVATLDQLLSFSLSRQRLSAVLLTIFAGLALTLATIGIYGVMSYAVAQQTRAIGIRMALGASRSRVTGSVLREAYGLTLAGTIVGVVGAAAVTRYMESLLFGVSAVDLPTFAIVIASFGAAAIAAAYLPARRAATVDPLVALRTP
jgi:putative ABC transport system permease protein